MCALIVIHAELLQPPSWPPSVRDLTLYLKTFCGAPDIVVDCGGSEWVDFHVRWLRQHHYDDFIDDFQATMPAGEGIHLRAQPPRFRVLAPETLHYIQGVLQSLLRPEPPAGYSWGDIPSFRG